jgi:cell division protein FtsA
MFGLGGMAFTKHLAHEFTLGFEHAEKLKLGYSHGKLDEGIRASVEELLIEDSRVWLGGLELALSEFSENDFLPNKILLCGGGSGLKELRNALSDPSLTSALSFAKPPEVSFLHPKDVSRLTDSTGELTTPQDVTPMSLASLAIEMLGEEKLLSGILRRTAKKIGT